MRKTEVTPSSDWPVGRRIVLTDAYYQNPIDVKVRSHPNADHLVCEDDRGVIHYARTDRVMGFVGETPEPADDFADILG